MALKKTNIFKRFKFSALDLMVLPALIYIFINNYVPMAGLTLAFKKIDYSKGLFGGDWVGLDNFKFLFSTKDAWIITRNTLLYNLAFIIITSIMGILVGIMLSEIIKKYMTKFYQTVILLPQLISAIIIAYIVFAFLSNETGLLNKTILPMFGLDQVNFYNEEKYWPWILILVNTWKALGYSSIIYFSSIVGIDNSLYESAKIDGAGKLQQIYYITLPMLKPTVTTLVIMQIGRMFYSDFGLFFQVPMNSGALFDVTNTIDTYVYRGLLQLNDVAKASAAGAYQSIVGFILIICANAAVRKFDKDNALF